MRAETKIDPKDVEKAVKFWLESQGYTVDKVRLEAKIMKGGGRTQTNDSAYPECFVDLQIDPKKPIKRCSDVADEEHGGR